MGHRRGQMAKRIPWSRDELLIAFRLYCRIPFGKIHSKNPEIVEMSCIIRRTPSAIAMKACNFASLDPTHKRRKVKGLGNTSKADRAIWQDFKADAEAIASEAEETYARIVNVQNGPSNEWSIPTGPTEIAREKRTRRVQSFFRTCVLASYDNRCALTGLAVPELLNASHIIPWSQNRLRRADPSNGIALNVLHDRAFDRGFITFDESMCVVVSSYVKVQKTCLFHRQNLIALEGRKLQMPQRFEPDATAICYHRENVFLG